MGIWSFYFLGKLYLYFRGYVRFNFILNLLLMVFIILPVSKTLPLSRYLKATKCFLSVVLAFLLLWYDSWLPPLLYSISTIAQIGVPSEKYIVRFLINSVNLWEVIVLIVLFAFCFFIQNRIRLTPIVFVLILIVPLLGLGHKKEGMGDYLDTFYESESGRTVSFGETDAENEKFDIIILHVCSLSWDDLKTTGLESHQFLRQFDFLFSNFNSVSSYTNPSAIRLLRANCGQQKHNALYNNAPKKCYLFESLRTQGYETYSAIDNDAPEYNFVADIITHGLADPPIETKGIPITQYDFDGTPIFNDLVLLQSWWNMRQKSRAERAALYFDITTLHAGAYWADEKEWWKRDRASQYKEFVQTLFGNLEKFFDMMASSGKNFVVIFIPEHGMALRGSSIQAPDLRDIPLPNITLVPVGIKLIGKGYRRIPVQQEVISRPTSYLAISYLIASFLKDSPFEAEKFSFQDILADIPETRFVSENQEALVVKKETDYFLYGKDKKWVKLPSSALK